MKNLNILFVLFATCLIACARPESLLGTWQSNKEDTMARAKTQTHLSPQQLATIAKTVGTTTFTFDRKTLVIQEGEASFSTPYSIVGDYGDLIVIQSNNPKTQKPEQSTFYFDGKKAFWTPDVKIPGFRERFDKVEETLAQ